MMRVIILENIRSVHNVGSVFRTADGAGFDKVYCCGYTPDPTDKRMEKVSLGAEKSVSWERADSVAELCRKLKAESYELIALETGEKSENIFHTGPLNDKKTALIFGHEVDGISEEVIGLADRKLSIPMHGHKESLNISVAAGIAMYAIAERLNTAM